MSWLFASVLNAIADFRSFTAVWLLKFEVTANTIQGSLRKIMEILDTLKTEIETLQTEVSETKAVVLAQNETIKEQTAKIELLTQQIADQPVIKAELENIVANIKAASAELDGLQPKPPADVPPVE